MNRLYLIRHGENLANITKEFSYKKVDYPLTEKGIEQARQTARYLRQRGLDYIYSSPLKRALETAEIIGEVVGQPVTVDENFREINVGDFEGHPTPENWRRFKEITNEWYKGNLEASFPGGESFAMLRERALQAFRDVLRGKEGCAIAIVAHGGIFTSTVADICREQNAAEIIKAELPNCGITELQAGLVDGEVRGRLISWAYCEHLSGQAAELTPAMPGYAYDLGSVGGGETA